MQFCQHHNNHRCQPGSGSDSTLTDSEQSPDGFSVSDSLERPLARVLARVETFNLVAGRHSNTRAAPCPVLVSRLLSSHQATSHHRFYQDCQDCADFASSLSQALRCLLRLGNIHQRLQKVRNSFLEAGAVCKIIFSDQSVSREPPG